MNQQWEIVSDTINQNTVDYIQMMMKKAKDIKSINQMFNSSMNIT